MEDRKLTDLYSRKIIGEEQIGERKTWVLQLTATVDDVAYHSQKMWIDTERFVPLKQEMYAKSGQLLKQTELKEVKKIADRWFPSVIVYTDVLKGGKRNGI